MLRDEAGKAETVALLSSPFYPISGDRITTRSPVLQYSIPSAPPNNTSNLSLSQRQNTQLEEQGRLSAQKLSLRKYAIDDYIGMESCVDLKDDGNHDDEAELSPGNFSGRNICAYNKRAGKMWGMKRQDFPPPIPLLVRTENLPSHMPWVLKRHYTADGRLILTEEKVRHHEYFRAHRSDGRLMLQLVAVDDDVIAPHFSGENVEVGHTQDPDDCVVEAGNGDQNESPKMVVAGAGTGTGGCGEAGKCSMYGDVTGGDSAFAFGVAVRGRLRTVQS